MKVSVFKLSGRALDVAVAKATGRGIEFECPDDPWLTEGGIADQPLHSFTPSTDWHQGGALIERECIGVEKHRLDGPYQWAACEWHPVVVQGHTCLERSHYVYGATQLEAAMRCFVIKHIGKEIDIPEELL